MRNIAEDESQLMIAIGQAIASCRNTLGMTETELATQFGISGILLSQIEQGQADIDLIMLERCASVFGITIVELLELAETLKDGGEVVCLDFSGDDESAQD